MKIENSSLDDLTIIFECYRIATAYMKAKNQVAWPEFSRVMIVDEIKNKQQWKILIDDQIACIWATTLSDELIWGKENVKPALYIHRIATHPDFRGQKLVKKIVNWADDFCIKHDLKYIRLDTVGKNEGLIHHYTKLGFDFLGIYHLENTDGLPEHYNAADVCLFQREVKKSN